MPTITLPPPIALPPTIAPPIESLITPFPTTYQPAASIPPSTCTDAVTPPLTMQLPPHSQMTPINPTVTPPTLPVINPPSQAQSPHVDTPSNQRLLDPEEVIDKYPKLRKPCNVGRLAVRLAAEAYFGNEVLKKSTFFGQKG